MLLLFPDTDDYEKELLELSFLLLFLILIKGTSFKVDILDNLLINWF